MGITYERERGEAVHVAHSPDCAKGPAVRGVKEKATFGSRNRGTALSGVTAPSRGHASRISGERSRGHDDITENRWAVTGDRLEPRREARRETCSIVARSCAHPLSHLRG